MNVAFCICMQLIKEMGFHDRMVPLPSTITAGINLLALLFREKGIVLFIFLKSDFYKYLDMNCTPCSQRCY